MSVSVLPIVALEEAADETISGALTVHHLELLSVPDNDADFKVFGWLLRYVPHWACLLWRKLLIDLRPHDQGALAHLRAWMAQSPVLDRLVLERLEVAAEVAIFKVDNGRTNQVITEEQIIIPHLYLQERATGENSLEFVHLVDVWRGFICLIVVSVASDFLTECDLYERI